MTIECLQPVNTPFQSEISLPGSKSISNRALIMAALADGETRLSNILLSDDTLTCLSALQALGINIEVNPQAKTCVLQGSKGQFSRAKAELYCHESGTVSRFLLCAAACCPGQYRFSAAPRMQERPIQSLLNALEQQGANFEFLDHASRMPFIMRSQGIQGGDVAIELKESSQFLSGLLMAAPYAKQVLKIQAGDVSQKPYVAMTLKLMESFGCHVQAHLGSTSAFTVPISGYHGIALAIEPDASTASYFFAAAALTGSEVTVLNLRFDALQRDVEFVRCLEKMGCFVEETTLGIKLRGPQHLKGLGEISLAGFTDTFMTLAVVAVFANSPTTIRGLRHTRLQESDRVSAMAEGLVRLGIQVETTEDSITIIPGAPISGIVDSHNDHRIAMSLALMGLKTTGVQVQGAEAVSKTCPDYFQLMSKVTSGSRSAHE